MTYLLCLALLYMGLKFTFLKLLSEEGNKESKQKKHHQRQENKAELLLPGHFHKHDNLQTFPLVFSFCVAG